MHARDRAFSVSDIQDQIFSCNTDSDNARCARVCRGWNDIALDHVWREQYSLKPLLSLLAPLKPVGHEVKSLRFARPLRPNDWVRFLPYARRIRTLRVYQFMTDGVTWILKLDKEVFRDLTLSRPTFRLLPNLVHVTLGEFCEYMDLQAHSALLLHENVQSLSVQLDRWDVRLVDRILEEISARCPRLRSVRTGLYPFQSNVLHSFRNFTLSFTCLEDLSMTSFMLSPKVLLSLGSLKHLQNLRVSPFEGKGKEDNVKGFQHVRLDAGMFPRLRLLEIQGGLQDLGQFFAQNPSPLQHLTDVSIHQAFGCNAHQLQSFLDALSSTARHLECLRIYRKFVEEEGGDEEEAVIAMAAKKGPITAAILHPLTRFSCLRFFSVEHAQPVDMTDEELVDIISKCNALRSLRLNERPLSLGETSLTLGVLERLAVCTKLQDLGIYVDARLNVVPEHMIERVFTSLECLYLGMSPISSPILVAAHLGQVLPVSCQCQADGELVVFPPFPGDDRTELWNAVAGTLPTLTRTWEETRSRVSALETEIMVIQNEMAARREDFHLQLAARDEDVRRLCAKNDELRTRLQALEPLERNHIDKDDSLLSNSGLNSNGARILPKEGY